MHNVLIKRVLSERVAYVAAAGFLSLSEWSFTICPTPYNRKYNVLSVSLNKIFPSFLNITICVIRLRFVGPL